MKHLLLVLVALGVVPAVDAQPESAYYGLSLGEFDYDEGERGFADTVSSYRLMVGYQFMEYLGVEGGYGETGTIRDSALFIEPVAGQVRPVNFLSDFKMLTIRLLGILPFDNGVSLLGGLAYVDLKQDATLEFTGFSELSFDSDRNEPAYYIGAQYDWDRVAVRLAYEKYDFSGGVDANETSVTFFYKL